MTKNDAFWDLWDSAIVAADYDDARSCGLASAMLACGWLRGQSSPVREAALVEAAREAGEELWREASEADAL